MGKQANDPYRAIKRTMRVPRRKQVQPTPRQTVEQRLIDGIACTFMNYGDRIEFIPWTIENNRLISRDRQAAITLCGTLVAADGSNSFVFRGRTFGVTHRDDCAACARYSAEGESA